MVTTTLKGDGSVVVTPSEGQTGGEGTGTSANQTYKNRGEALSAIANETGRGTRGAPLPGVTLNSDGTYNGRDISLAEASRLGLIDKPEDFGMKAVSAGISPQEAMRQSSQKSIDDNMAAFAYGQTVDNLSNIPRAGSAGAVRVPMPIGYVEQGPSIQPSSSRGNTYYSTPITDRPVNPFAGQYSLPTNPEDVVSPNWLPEGYGNELTENQKILASTRGQQLAAESILWNERLNRELDSREYTGNIRDAYTSTASRVFAGSLTFGGVAAGVIFSGFEKPAEFVKEVPGALFKTIYNTPKNIIDLGSDTFMKPYERYGAVGGTVGFVTNLAGMYLFSKGANKISKPIVYGTQSSIDALRDIKPRLVETSELYSSPGLGVFTKKKLEIRLKADKPVTDEDSFLPHPKKNKKLEPILTAKRTPKDDSLRDKWKLRDDSNKGLSGSVNKEGQVLLTTQLTKQRTSIKDPLRTQKHKYVSQRQGNNAQASRLRNILKKKELEKTEQRIDSDFKQMSESQTPMSLGQFALTNIAMASAYQRLAQKNAQDILGAQKQQFNTQQGSLSFQKQVQSSKQKESILSLSLQMGSQQNLSIQRSDSLQRNMNMNRTDTLSKLQAPVKSRTQFQPARTRAPTGYRFNSNTPRKPRKTAVLPSGSSGKSDFFRQPDKRIKTNQQQSYGNHDPLYPASLESVTFEEMSLGGGQRARHMGSRKKSQKYLSRLVSSGQPIPTLSQSRHRTSKSNWRKLNL